MKILVKYTFDISGEDMKALRSYHRSDPGFGRNDIRQILIDEGQGGLDEQISQGRTWYEHEQRRKAELG